MKRMSILVVAWAACAGAVGAAQNETLVLAERGKAPQYAIVKGAMAGECETYAAEELRSFLAQTTGVTLPIVTDAAPLPTKAIVLGAAGGNPSAGDLGEDGFRLWADGDRLRIVASPKRGVLYGVYSVLERFAGCRWYASRCSRIPSLDAVCVPTRLDDTERPAFLMREAYWYDALRHPEYAARLRLNGYNHARSAPAKLGGDSFRFGGGLSSCHTFGRLLPVAKYFKDHPEYFALRDGKREIKEERAHWGYTQLCLTNPEVLEIVASNVIECIRRDPGAKFYGVSQNDNQLYCECPACAAVDAEEGSHAGTVVRFVNAVAERVEKVFPDVVIETLAYQYSRTPPKTRLRHNVVPCLCTIECDYSRAIDESPCAQNVKFRSDIEGWKTQTDQLYVWDYTTDFANYTIPFPNVLALQGNIKFFRANNVKEVFEQGDAQGAHGDFAELKTWLLAKWLWNPDLPAEPLLDEFFRAYYGAGAPFVREYFDELHRLQRAYTADGRHSLGCFIAASNPALDDAFLRRAADLWAKAAAAVQDDPATSYNVRMGAFTVDSLRVQRYQTSHDKVLWLAKGEPRSEQPAMKARAASLLARMKEAKYIRLAESPKRHDAILKTFTDMAEAPLEPIARGVERGTVEERHIHVNKLGTWGEYVDDPLAEDGKAIKMFNTHYEWCTQLWMKRIAFEPGVPYKLRMRVRCEKASAGAAFWAGVYDPAAKCGRGQLVRRTDQVADGYVWYDVCTWVPKESEYFWIGPGQFKKNGGKSAIKALYLDKVEFVKIGR